MADENIIEINRGDIVIDIDNSSDNISITTESTVNLDYYYVTNKPKINSQELVGNLVSEEIHLVSPDDLEVLEQKFENIEQKVENIDGNSTHDEYPSAKCVFENLNTKLNKNQITNCILEEPRNIKLELNSGVLTLKAGSVVCVPNGFESDGTTPKFDEVVIENDIVFSATGTATNSFLYFSTLENKFVWTINNSSGSGQGATNYMHYRTDLNKVYYNNFTDNLFSFPIAIFSYTASTVTSIVQTFNSIGYMGSTVFIRKGFKGLAPRGRNEDGSLNNIELVADKVYVKTFSETGGRNLYFSPYKTGDPISSSPNRQYNSETNIIAVEYDSFEIAYCIFTNGVVSNFKPCIVTNLLKYGDTYLKEESDNRYVNVSGDTMTGTLIAPYVRVSKSTVGSVDVQNTSVTRTISPTTDAETQCFRFIDKNGDVMGQIGLERYANGRQCMKMQVFTQDQAAAPAFRIYVDTNGKATYSPVQLITSYVSGASGYNIWSNGYCEQWGNVTASGSGATTSTVTFLKIMKDTNYHPICNYTANSNSQYGQCYELNVNKMTIKTYGGVPCRWVVKGYLASGQY